MTELSHNDVIAHVSAALTLLAALYQRLPPSVSDQSALDIGQATGLLSKALAELREAEKNGAS